MANEVIFFFKFPKGNHVFFLTSSLCHPEISVKEFFNGFVAFHDHCPGEKLSVEWQTDLYGRHCLSHSQHLVYA